MQRPRERIFVCAQDLFHRRGIRGVGVDAIAEAAGTNKMTLYRHFGSKDDLVLEYLNYKGKKSDEVWRRSKPPAREIQSANFTALSRRPRNLSNGTSAAATLRTPPSN